MQFVQGKNLTCFICFGIENLSNFVVVKSLRKFGGCLMIVILLSFESKF